MDLLEKLDLIASTYSQGRRGPLTDTVHGEDGSFLERGGEEGARRVRFVVLRVEKRALIVQLLTDLPVHEELFLDPEWTGFEKGPEPQWGHMEIGLEDAFELEQGLVVEPYEGEV